MKVPEPRKMSSGNYYIQLRLGGKSISVTAPTEAECKNKAALIKAQYKTSAPKQTRVATPLTLEKAISAYIKSKSNTLSPSTIRGYNTIKNTRFQSVMKKPISSVKNWQSVCNDEAAECSAKTLKNAWGLVKTVLNENGITTNVKLPQVPVAEKQYLTPDEIKVFVKAVKGKECEIPALLALHSLRRSEILALDWSNVNLKKKDIYVKGAVVFNSEQKLTEKPANKNRSSTRHVPIMMQELVDALNAIENKTGKVTNCNPNTMWRQINKVCKDNGLPEVGVHGLRHSFCSLAYHLNMPEKIAMQIGGWSDFGTMRKIYTHISAADVQAQAVIMANFYKAP